MLSLKQIMKELGGINRNDALKLLTDTGVRCEVRNSRNGRKIYFDITQEQIRSGMLKKKDPKQIAIQQSTALKMLESKLNRQSMFY